MTKKEKILKSALTLFVRDGIDATSTARIAKESGVASGLIFHYFKNKDGLVQTLFLELKNKISEINRTRNDLSCFTRENFRTMWMNGIRSGMNEIETIRFIHQFKYSRYIRLEEREKGKSFFTEQHAYFRDGIQKGILKNMDVELMGEIVFEQMLLVITYIQEGRGSIEDIESYYKIARDSIFS